MPPSGWTNFEQRKFSSYVSVSKMKLIFYASKSSVTYFSFHFLSAFVAWLNVN